MYPIHVSPSEIHISKCFFSFPLTSHSISHLPVSFTCSPSCYILPSLWEWQSYIRHVIKREMGGSIGVAWGGWWWQQNGVTSHPCLLNDLLWHVSVNGPFGTQDSSPLQWAVSDFTAHGSPHTPTPDIQLGGCGEMGRLQLQKCSSLPLTHDGKSPVVPHLSVGPYLLLNLLPRGHNVTLILTTVGLHHIYSVPCCQTGLCWSIPSVGSCCLQCVAQWVPWSQWLKCNKFMISSVHWDRRLITFHSVSPCFHFCSFISSVVMVIIVNSLI